MSAFIAFWKKEWMEQKRSGRLLLLLILFAAFGIMNPAIAKLTPWLLEAMSESLAESGMTVGAVQVDAITSWVQFFKNLPMALIVFVVAESGIFAKEYQAGTLILSVTKGMPRGGILLAKAGTMSLLWTGLYLLYFLITYSYNAYFWDNGVAQSLGFAVAAQWLLGLWVLSLIVLFSTIFATGTGVLLGTGGAYLVAFLVSLFPRVASVSPCMLADGNSLIYGMEEPSAYLLSVTVTATLTLAAFLLSLPLLKKRSLG